MHTAYVHPTVTDVNLITFGFESTAENKDS